MIAQKRVAGVLVLAAAVLGCAAVYRHYRKTQATALMQQYMLIPVSPQLASFPGGMPGNGFSGRATNEEDYTDPYGGGDKPGPYGRVNDPYDGDWALGPLGGKAVTMQGLRAVRRPNNAREDPNIWDENAMGTNSIFMGTMRKSEAFDPRRLPPRQQAMMNRASAQRTNDRNKQQMQPADDMSWVGTNAAFFGANGGGYGLARGQKKGLARAASAKGTTKKAPKVAHKQAMMKTRLQTLFRSDDPNEAEYGREGDNVLDDSVLPSAVGTGGPVLGVDGEPSNVGHSWKHIDEPFSFACSEDIPGCKDGLTVDEIYAKD